MQSRIGEVCMAFSLSGTTASLLADKGEKRLRNGSRLAERREKENGGVGPAYTREEE